MYFDKKRPSEIGQKGEKMVAEYLKSQGYTVIKRNYKDRYGEVDIIAEDCENLVFIEVKTRSENAIVSGLDAVDEKKKRLIKNEAVMFTKRLKTDLEPRVDVAEVTLSVVDGKEVRKLKYIKNAY